MASTGGRSRARLTEALAVRAVRPFHSATSQSSLSHHDGFYPELPHLKLCRGRGQHIMTVLCRAGESKGSRAAVAGRMPREGSLGHVVWQRGASECKRVVL